jgi:hypothetical protein
MKFICRQGVYDLLIIFIALSVRVCVDKVSKSVPEKLFSSRAMKIPSMNAAVQWTIMTTPKQQKIKLSMKIHSISCSTVQNWQ